MRDADDWLAERFEDHRRRLSATAERILGSAADADDAVQETWLRFSRADADGIDDLGSWLTTVVSRVCLNMLQARRTRPQPPVDADAPEPISDRPDGDPEQEAVLADTVGLALHVVLDSLTPAERVAFVLHDVFAIPFDEIAPIVDRSTVATRQLASRARARVRRHGTTDAQEESRRSTLVDAFLAAARDGDFDALLAVLDPDVVLRADDRAVQLGAAAETRGAVPVATFLRRARGALRAVLDGAPAAVWRPGGELRVVYAFTIDGGRVTAIDLIADPDRLGTLDLVIEDD